MSLKRQTTRSHHLEDAIKTLNLIRTKETVMGKQYENGYEEN
jgi:hypothetical protein